jgi:predicted RNA-binding protein with PUA-like domain
LLFLDKTKSSNMNYWLVKTEPDTYSWADLQRDKKTTWDGVRNFQARTNIKKMEKGDTVFFYHTGDVKAIVGIATVAAPAYPEPRDNDWFAVDLVPKKALKNMVTLAQIKADKRLVDMTLVRAPRLSVQPVTAVQFDIVIALSEA